MVAENLNSGRREAWYSPVDKTYAYGHLPLHLLTSKPCNFQIIGGESTGSYRFVTDFYGLTDFQKEIDLVLARFREMFVFISILTKHFDTYKGTKGKTKKCRKS